MTVTRSRLTTLLALARADPLGLAAARLAPAMTLTVLSILGFAAWTNPARPFGGWIGMLSIFALFSLTLVFGSTALLSPGVARYFFSLPVVGRDILSVRLALLTAFWLSLPAGVVGPTLLLDLHPPDYVWPMAWGLAGAGWCFVCLVLAFRGAVYESIHTFGQGFFLGFVWVGLHGAAVLFGFRESFLFGVVAFAAGLVLATATVYRAAVAIQIVRGGVGDLPIADRPVGDHMPRPDATILLPRAKRQTRQRTPWRALFQAHWQALPFGDQWIAAVLATAFAILMPSDSRFVLVVGCFAGASTVAGLWHLGWLANLPVAPQSLLRVAAAPAVCGAIFCSSIAFALRPAAAVSRLDGLWGLLGLGLIGFFVIFFLTIWHRSLGLRFGEATLKIPGWWAAIALIPAAFAFVRLELFASMDEVESAFGQWLESLGGVLPSSSLSTFAILVTAMMLIWCSIERIVRHIGIRPRSRQVVIAFGEVKEEARK